MKRGFFSRFTRDEVLEPAREAPVSGAPEATTGAETAAATVTGIVREIARRELPSSPRKTAVSLRLDIEVLDWFKAQGPGYQTRINAILRAYRDAASAAHGR